MKNYTSNMIKYRMEFLDSLSGELSGDRFLMAMDEYSFLSDLDENETKRVRQVTKAAKLADRLTTRIENMDLDCDPEVYEALCDIVNLLEGR